MLFPTFHLLLLTTLALAMPRSVEHELHALIKRGGKCSAATEARYKAGIQGLDKSIKYTKQESAQLNRIDSAERAQRAKLISSHPHHNPGHKKRSLEDLGAELRVTRRALEDAVEQLEVELEFDGEYFVPVKGTAPGAPAPAPSTAAGPVSTPATGPASGPAPVPAPKPASSLRLLRRGTPKLQPGGYDRGVSKEVAIKTNKLKGIYNQAVDQRKANQKTFPSSSKVQSYLSTYEQRQKGAGKTIASLTGNYDKDKNTIKMLRTGFAGGTKLNEEAKEVALSQCKRDLERMDWIQENYLPQVGAAHDVGQ